MLAFTASLCVSSLVALVSSHKLDGTQYGSKSSYFTVANQDASSLENYAGCEPLMMWMYIRHGSRNPGDDEIIEMTTLLPELRDRITAAADAGKGSLTFKEINDLKDWSLVMDPSEDKLLTESGQLEAREMGKRWRQRMPNFLGDENNVESRSSYKSRTIETGNSFLEGLEMPQNTYVDNSKAIYYKNEFGCDRYEQEVYDNDNVTEAEAIKFTQSQAWADMIEGISQRTGVQVTPDEARLAHKMCKYQLAAEPERYHDEYNELITPKTSRPRVSVSDLVTLKQSRLSSSESDTRYTDANYTTAEYPPWCNIFSKEDMALWEFENDLEAHYGSGPAFDITTYATHKLFTEIYDLIDAHSFGGQLPNASAIFTFGHSGGIKPIINSFEIFRDDFNLTAEDWGTDVVEEHKWKISDIATFASNIGLILYSCSEGAEQKVMLTHNEHIIDEQPACGETLCSVDQFKAYYQHIVDFDWDSECPMPEVSTEVSVDNNNENTDVSGGSNPGINININIDINHGNGDNSEDVSGGSNNGNGDNGEDEDDDEDCDSSEEDCDDDDSDEDDSSEEDSSEEKDEKHKKGDKKCKKSKKCKKDDSSEEESEEK